jgi:hypothetical protein
MMPASYEDLSAWFDRGVCENATHLIVVCDTYEYEDYPVYVMPGTDVRQKADEYSEESMQRVMEVYVLDPLRKNEQMRERRAFHYEMPTPKKASHWSDTLAEACERYIQAHKECGQTGSMTEARELLQAGQQVRETAQHVPEKL